MGLMGFTVLPIFLSYQVLAHSFVRLRELNVYNWLLNFLNTKFGPVLVLALETDSVSSFHSVFTGYST